MARVPFIAGNWKLNKGPMEAGALAEAMVEALSGRGAVDVALFPTALAATAVRDAVDGSGIEVGLQEVHSASQGAYTGTNSAAMARAAGLTRVLIGHSERRQLFGETNAGVRAKVEHTLACGLLPIVCVGETLEQRDAGRVEDIVHGQIAAALEGLAADQAASITLAYEPVWAIGTGRTASPQQAQDVHASIRGWLRAHFPAFVADDMRIQYGGSVKPHNAAELLACEDIDGALVGGASLKAADFAAIVAAAG